MPGGGGGRGGWMCVPVSQCQLWRGAHCGRGENIKLFGHRAVLSDVSGWTGAESLQCAAKVHRSISVNKQDHRDTDQALGPRITPEGHGGANAHVFSHKPAMAHRFSHKWAIAQRLSHKRAIAQQFSHKD